jgi:hypothetical protein
VAFLSVLPWEKRATLRDWRSKGERERGCEAKKKPHSPSSSQHAMRRTVRVSTQTGKQQHYQQRNSENKT